MKRMSPPGISNNAVYCSYVGIGYPVYISSLSELPLEMDHNDWSASWAIVGKAGGVNYTTLADWQMATGLDTNSIIDDPLFTSTTDLHILPASPCGDTGLSIFGIISDFDGESRGDPPEIGADEFPPCIHHGDVDFNGSITAGDAQLAFSITVGSYTPSLDERCAADCNADDTVTAGDAQAIFGVIFGGTCVDPL